jgi:hypothetical protein
VIQTSIFRTLRFAANGKITADDFKKKIDLGNMGRIYDLEGLLEEAKPYVEAYVRAFQEFLLDPTRYIRTIVLAEPELDSMKTRIITVIESCKRIDPDGLHAEIDAISAHFKTFPIKPGQMAVQTEVNDLPLTRLGRREYDHLDLAYIAAIDRRKEMFARGEGEVLKITRDLLSVVGVYIESTIKAFYAFTANLERRIAREAPLSYSLMLGDYTRELHMRSFLRDLRNSIHHVNYTFNPDHAKREVDIIFRNTKGLMLCRREFGEVTELLDQLNIFGWLAHICLVQARELKPAT